MISNEGLPLDIFSTNDHLENLYQYLEADEFREHTCKVRNGTSPTPQKSHDVYANIHKTPLTAMRLSVFSKLTTDLNWLEVIHKQPENKQFRWGYDVIFLNPSSVPDKPNQSSEKKLPPSKQHESLQAWAQRMLFNFYSTTFSLNEEQQVIVSDGLKVDQTIALIAFRQKAKSLLPNSFVRNKNTIVVAATTFRVCYDEKPGTAFVRWLGVRDMGPFPTHLFSSWRRKGIGSFLMKLIIKRCAFDNRRATLDTELPTVQTQTATKDSEITIDIFMQVKAIDSISFAFIQSIGFLDIDEVGLRNNLVHSPPEIFFQGISNLEKEWLPYLCHLRQCPVSSRLQGNTNTPATEDGDTLEAARKVQTEHADSIDVETPIATFEVSTSKGTEAPPDVIDVDAPNAIVTTVKGSTSVIDVDASDAILTTMKGSTSVIDVDAAVCIDGDATARPVMWCRYPPTAQQQRDVTTRLLYNDIVAATSGLSHIRVLLPHPLQDPLCPPDAFCVGGEMLSIRRIQHSEKNGTDYISLGELDMMLAVIMADGRYNDHVTIIPCSYTKNVSLASEAYSDYVNARLQLQFLQTERDTLRTSKGNENDFTFSINEDHPKWEEYCNVKERLKEHDALTQRLCSELEISLKLHEKEELHYKTMNFVVEKVLRSNPCILTKKLIVFPFCAENHWTATFIFNASCIDTFGPETPVESRNLVPTFLRYCPYEPSGSGDMPMKHGILFLLNLAYSFSQHCKLPSFKDVPMKMLEVFHSSSKHYLRGTRYFPAMRITGRRWLPKQIDTHNCAFGVLAAVASILRDVVGKNNEHDERYCKTFARYNIFIDEIEGVEADDKPEFFIDFPRTLHNNKLTGNSGKDCYLANLREEFFVLFDRLAELYWITIPRRVSVRPTEEMHTNQTGYEKTKALLRWPHNDFQHQEEGEKDRAASTLLELLGTHSEETNEDQSTDSSDSEDEESSNKEYVDQKRIEKNEVPEVGNGSEMDFLIDLEVKLADEKESRETKDNGPQQGETVVDQIEHSQFPTNTDDPVQEDGQMELYQFPTDAELSQFAPDTASVHDQEHRQMELSQFPKDADNPMHEDGQMELTKLPTESDSVHEQEKSYRKKSKKRKLSGQQLTNSIQQNAHESFQQRKLKREDLPWLEIPTDDMLEFNTWEANWKDVGRGDPNHFFGIQEVLEMEPKSQANLLEQESPPFAQESLVAYYEKWEKCNEVRPIDTNAMDVYVEKRFLEWNWSSNEQHQMDLQWYRQIMTSSMEEAKSTSQKEIIKLYYTELLKAMKKERRHFRRQFENDYLLDEAMLVTGVKYVRPENKFVARVQYTDDKGDNVEKHIPVTEEWFRKEAGFANDVINHVLNLESDGRYFPIPADMEVFLDNKKITRVKFVPEHTRNVLDYAKVIEMRETQKEDLPVKRSPQKQKPKKKEVPRKDVSVPAHWSVVNADGKRVRKDLEFLDNVLPTKFLNELKETRTGFVDIPVGDWKKSSLDQHPDLTVTGAPKVHFVQNEGEDLCVSNSFASALFELGFVNEATKIAEYGKEKLAQGTVNALKKVMTYASEVLPKWLQPAWKPRHFDWKNELNETVVFVGVLLASDGNSNHAVTIHGGFIYDANEIVAIPLCQKALDYCTCTETEKSTFIDFRRGFMFRYVGGKKNRIQAMTLPSKRAK